MKRTLVTGANAGLGLASSKQLAARGHHVLMLCRNPEKGAAALAVVQGHGSAELVLCDLADLDQVRETGARLAEAGLDGMLHNAGVVLTDYGETPQGFERTLAINHLAVMALTHAAWDGLAPDGRVTVVSSEAHLGAKLDLDHWMDAAGYATFRRYANSKLCNILFTLELARRAPGRAVNTLHPGAVATELGDENDVWYAPLGKLLKRLFRSPDKAADTQVWLAADAETGGRTGGYYVRRRPGRQSAAAKDPALARAVWDASAALLDIDPNWPR